MTMNTCNDDVFEYGIGIVCGICLMMMMMMMVFYHTLIKTSFIHSLLRSARCRRHRCILLANHDTIRPL